MKMNTLDWVAWLLVVIGGLNWGMIGIFEYNPIADIFGVLSGTSRVIYAAVGVATVYTLVKMSSMMPKPSATPPAK